MAATAKIFRHGRSQAVRLPKEFRFEGDEVAIRKIGTRVILEPLSEHETPWRLIDEIGGEPFPDRDQPDLPPDRPVFDP